MRRSWDSLYATHIKNLILMRQIMGIIAYYDRLVWHRFQRPSTNSIRHKQIANRDEQVIRGEKTSRHRNWQPDDCLCIDGQDRRLTITKNLASRTYDTEQIEHVWASEQMRQVNDCFLCILAFDICTSVVIRCCRQHLLCKIIKKNATLILL